MPINTCNFLGYFLLVSAQLAFISQSTATTAERKVLINSYIVAYEQQSQVQQLQHSHID